MTRNAKERWLKRFVRRAKQFDSCRVAISSPLKSSHLKYDAHHPILTSFFGSPFRFVRASLLRGVSPAGQPIGGGGEKNRVPLGQPALGD